MKRLFCKVIIPDFPPLTPKRAIGTFVLGLTAGSLGSLVGLGGAFVTLPILSGPFGLSAHYSIGTSVAATIATSIGASLSFLETKQQQEEKKSEEEENKNDLKKEISSNSEEPSLFGIIPIKKGDVHIIASIFIVTSSSIFAMIGAKFSKMVRDLMIRRLQGVFMMCIAPLIISRDYLSILNQTSSIDQNNQSEEKNIDSTQLSSYLSPSFGGKLLGIGIISGFLAGFFGVGGGAVVVPALVLVMDFDYKTALGTSMAAMIPTALSSGLIHFRQSTMVIPYSIPLGLGCVIGSYYGAKLVRLINEKEFKQFFSVTMFVLGFRTLIKALK